MERAYKLSISVIIPVHANADLIVDSVTKIHKFLSNNFNDFEIIIIDSGIDEAPAICDLISKALSSVRVIHDNIHTKFGSKIKIGYREARKDLVWLIPLDMPFPLEYGVRVIPLFDKYDCVFSYRTGDRRGYWRKLQTFIYNLLMYCFLGLKVKNVNSQFRILKREVVQKIQPISDGWFIDAEILYYITKLKIPYIEIAVPLIMHGHDKSSVNPLAFLGVLKEMFYFIGNKKI